MSKLKSDSPTDTIIVSFKSKWNKVVLNSQPEVVFRIRTPIKKVKRMFCYIGAPVSAIVGYANIIKTVRLNPPKALRLAKRGMITIQELDNYLKNRDSVGVYYLRKIHIFPFPVSLDSIRRYYNFYPPQSFMFISKDAENFLLKSGRQFSSRKDA